MTGEDLLRLEGKRVAEVVCHNEDSAYGFGAGFDLVAEDGTRVCVQPYSVNEHTAVMRIRELKRVKP